MSLRPVTMLCGLALSVALAGIAVASPPPPPSTFIDELADQIVPTPTVSCFDRYIAAFADDLTVTLNGVQIASTKAAWVSDERHRLGKIDRVVVAFVKGYVAVLVIERYDDQSDLPASSTLLFDPRYKARAVRYAVRPDHLIHNIQIVETDGVLQVPQ